MTIIHEDRNTASLGSATERALHASEISYRRRSKPPGMAHDFGRGLGRITDASPLDKNIDLDHQNKT